MFAGILALYAYAACALIFAPAHFATLMTEMGPLESVGALACFVAAILFFIAFAIALRSKSYRRALWLFSLGMATAFLALEEISWGQHIFGFATPASISALNAQHETNIHKEQAEQAAWQLQRPKDAAVRWPWRGHPAIRR